MERVLKFRDNQHEEDRVTKLHGGHQTDSGIDQNDEYEEESDEEATPENGLSRKAKKDVEKRRRRRRAKKKTKVVAVPAPALPTVPETKKSDEKSATKKKKKQQQSDDDDTNDDDDDANVEIEYVQEDMPIKRGDTYYSHFIKVFENFKVNPNEDDNVEYYYNKYGKKVAGPKVLLPRDKTNIDDNEDEEEDDKAAAQGDKKKKDDDDDDEQSKKKSKKQVKRETRLSVAQLKQLVIRPDVVEMFDVTAKDPKLLVHLKVSRSIAVQSEDPARF